MRMLLIDIDSLRPDHLGCYGYHRNTSPNIDAIAKQGVRFTNYYTSDAPCFPSRTALMTGQFGIRNGVVGHGGTAGDVRHEGETRSFGDRLARESLPAFLRSAGLKTVLISPFAERHTSWTFYAGFQEMYNTGRGGMESAEEITPTVLRWIDQNAQEDNWFLYVNFWDPHTPYRAPADFGNPFENDPLPEWLTEDVLMQHRQMAGPHTAREINMYDGKESAAFPRQPGELEDMDDLRRMVDGYDCGVRYADEHVGAIVRALREKGVMDELVVLITADHGENMGELGIYGEHGTADHATCRIPMIMRWPGMQSGQVDDGLHYHLDLGPTLAEMLEKAPMPSWDGQSYAKAILSGADAGREYLVISQCAHVCQRSVRFADWLYTRTYHDGFHLFDEEMLFDVVEDPHEQKNVAEDHLDERKTAVYYLNAWHDERMKSMPFDVDPLWTVMREGGPFHAKGHLPKYIARLRDTDRSDAAKELIRRHPREFQ